MNNLSWLIYGMQVLDGLRNLLFILAFLILLGLGVWLFFGCVVSDEDPEPLKAWRSHFCRWAVIAVSCIVLGILTPARSTLLLIAGSEVGQRIVQSQTSKEIIDPGLDLLKTWIATEKDRLLKSKD